MLTVHTYPLEVFFYFFDMTRLNIQTFSKHSLRKMGQLTVEQRVMIVDSFIRTQSYKRVQDEFSELYPNRAVPARSTILRNVKKFQRTGTTHNLNEHHSGRQRTARTAENIELVRNTLENNPRLSVRRNGTGISSASFNRITRLDLNFHPFVLKTRHALLPGDFQRRERYSQWLLNSFHAPGFIQSIIIGDEAAFQLNGKVNTHNLRCYAPRGHPPNDHFYEIPDSREKVTVWAALCGTGQILGPHFFDGNVNGDNYLNMINDVVVPEMMELFDYNIVDENLFPEKRWFQDGAPAHGTIIVRNRLAELFAANHVIALHHEREWPARSPDLTPCDIFLWGYLKWKVYQAPPYELIFSS